MRFAITDAIAALNVWSVEHAVSMLATLYCYGLKSRLNLVSVIGCKSAQPIYEVGLHRKRDAFAEKTARALNVELLNVGS